MSLRDLVIVPDFVTMRHLRRDPRFQNADFVPPQPQQLIGRRFKDVWIHEACFRTTRWDQCAAELEHLMSFSASRGEVRIFS